MKCMSDTRYYITVGAELAQLSIVSNITVNKIIENNYIKYTIDSKVMTG